MADSDLINKLKEYEDVLQISSMVNDALRSIGWIFVKGLSVLIDGLESITDQILLTNTFFNNSQVVEFVSTIQPFLYVLLAGSFLFTGYLLIFQKKFERESFLINLFITLLILGLLSPTMSRIQKFSDEAIDEIGTSSLYGEKDASLSEGILKRNIHDLIEHDSRNFETARDESVNAIPTDLIDNIRINEIFDKNNYDLSATGNKLAEFYILWNGQETSLGKLDQGGVEWNNQYYYRYQPNWLTIFVTLGIMGFTLFSIAYKLARLSFELAFNYVLALLVAPADLHSGQKTKKVIQSILNTFLVIILIFVSIKLYTIGTAYLAETLDGFAYLIALIAFSVALIDGPNMVERLFGIDAGLKRGWGVALGAYAAGKGVTSAGAHAVSKVAHTSQGAPKKPSLHEAATTQMDSTNGPHGTSSVSPPIRDAAKAGHVQKQNEKGSANETQHPSQEEQVVYPNTRDEIPRASDQESMNRKQNVLPSNKVQQQSPSGPVASTTHDADKNSNPDKQTVSQQSTQGSDPAQDTSASRPQDFGPNVESSTKPIESSNEQPIRHHDAPTGDAHTSASQKGGASSGSSSSSASDSSDTAQEKRQGRARRTIHQDTGLDIESEVLEQVRENHTHRNTQNHEETRRMYPTSPPRPDRKNQKKE